MVDINIASTTLEKLAELLGTTVQQIYTIYVGAQFGIHLGDAITIICAIVSAGVFGFWILKKVKAEKDKKDSYNSYQDIYTMFGLLGVFLIPIGVAIVMNAIVNIVLAFMFPQYFAINDMLHTASQFMPSSD
jgi:hypothetical protein